MLPQGYYADPEAECQAFHVCGADGRGGLTKYSFLCPNGTIFNQNYLICDWWFNFDCSEAEGLYSINDDIRAEQEANIGAVSADDAALADEGLAVYENDLAPLDDYSSAAADYPEEDIVDDYQSYEDIDAATEGPLEITESPLAAYGVDPSTPVFEETGLSETAGTSYGAPSAAEEAREERRRRLGRRGRGRGRSGRTSRFGRNRRGRAGRAGRAGRRGQAGRRNRNFRGTSRRGRNSRRNSRRNFRG